MSHLDEGVLHAVLDGEIPARDLAEIQKHLADCPECQQRFADARQFRDEALGMLERLDPTAATAVAAVDIARRSKPRWRIPVAWAATILGALGLGYSFGGLRARPDGVTAIPTEVAVAPTPATASTASTALTASTAPTNAGERDQRPSRRPEAAAPKPPAVAAGAVAAAPPASDDSAPMTVPSKALVSPAPSALAKVMPVPAAAELKDAREERAAAPPRSIGQVRQTPVENADRGGAQNLATRRDLLRADGPVIPNPADQRRRTISAVAAIAALGGSIRLIDGLTPARFEQQGVVVRVVYRTAVGTVVLEQWRAGELLAHDLIPPRDAPPDSVRVWESRVR